MWVLKKMDTGVYTFSRILVQVLNNLGHLISVY